MIPTYIETTKIKLENTKIAQFSMKNLEYLMLFGAFLDARLLTILKKFN